MPETEPVGDQGFIIEYLERVGAFDTDSGATIPHNISKHLIAVETARYDWLASCQGAASAELRYRILMGHGSHRQPEEAKLERGVTHLSPGGRIIERKYEGYGSTLAAHQAVVAEANLRETCEKTDEEIQADPDVDPLQKIVMHAVLGRDYPDNPAQKDSLEYAAEAFELIETARAKSDQPMVMVRRRWYSPMTVGGSPDRYNMSDIITAEEFELLPNEEELQLVLRGVKRVIFEKYSSSHVGGRTGLIGSGHWEESWQALDKKDMKVEAAEQLKAMNLLDHRQIGKNVDSSFSALRILGVNDPTDFSKLDDFRETFAGMGRYDPFRDGGNETGLCVVQGVDLEQLVPPIDGNTNAIMHPGFGKGLANAQKVLLEDMTPSRRRLSPRMAFLLK